jgi:hypothetical protein
MRSCGLLSVFSIYDSSHYVTVSGTAHPSSARYLEDLTPKGCACSAHRQEKQDPLRKSRAGANNPVGINETVVRTRRTNLTRGFASCLDYCP